MGRALCFWESKSGLRDGRAVPEYYVNDEPFGLGSPVSKNWFYQTFDTPAVTYEVGDESDRALIRRLSTVAAEAMMALLLDEVE